MDTSVMLTLATSGVAVLMLSLALVHGRPVRSVLRWHRLTRTPAPSAAREARVGGASVLRHADASDEVLLRRGEEYFRALIENGSDLLAVLRADGRIRYQSPSVVRVLGHDAVNAQDRPLADFLHPDDVPVLLEGLSDVLQEPGRRGTVLVRARHADGGIRHLEAVVQNLVDHPAVSGLVLTARDVTDRVEVERVLRAKDAQLRQAQKMEAVGRLAGGVAHDFNNILTIIGGHAEFLSDRLEPADPRQEDVVAIADAVEGAARLTRQLLVFSRRDVAQPRLLDLSESVAALHKLARRLMPETVDFRIRLEAGAGRILADPGHVEQILMNLLVNARDAVGERGVVEVATWELRSHAVLRTAFADLQPGRYVVLSVRDDGCGMPPEVRDRIFEPFFTTKGSGGTGLGLSTVFAIVRECGGAVHVESDVGAGSEFRVYFPAHDVEAAPDLAPGLASDRPGGGTETILYAEDDERLQKVTVRVLRDRGYRVLAAPSGADALRLADLYREPIHLVLTDVVMPGGTGPQLHTRLEERRGRIPVLYLSGHTGHELGRQGFDGARLLRKPYGSDVLLRKIRAVLDGD